MKLIVGLGNPGRKYAETRHNIGFEVVAKLAKKFAAGTPRSKFDGEYVEVTISGQKVLLVWPHTFMNNSGSCVQPLSVFFKIETQDILIVCDDLSLPVAKLRFRAKGSAGGQKGLEDIIRRVGSDEISRLRIGIGAVPEGRVATDYVLGRFSAEEAEAIKGAVEDSAVACEQWVDRGISHCMNVFNR